MIEDELAWLYNSNAYECKMMHDPFLFLDFKLIAYKQSSFFSFGFVEQQCTLLVLCRAAATRTSKCEFLNFLQRHVAVAILSARHQGMSISLMKLSNISFAVNPPHFMRRWYDRAVPRTFLCIAHMMQVVTMKCRNRRDFWIKQETCIRRPFLACRVLVRANN